MQGARHIRWVLAAALVLGVHAGLFAWYRYDVMADGVSERTLAQFRELRGANAPIETLAFGDSHVKWGIHPEFMRDAFNFAMPGESYAESYYRLRSLVDDESLPVRAIVLQADPHSLAARPLEWLGFYHYYAWFVDYPELGRRRGEPLYFTVRWLTGRYAPYAGQRSYVFSFLETGLPPEVPWLKRVPMRRGALVPGGGPLFSAAELREKARERTEVHFRTGSPFDATNEHYLGRILELCEARGIRVLLVRFPLTRAYRNALRAYVEEQAFDARVAAIANGRTTVQVLDARRAFDSTPELFTDVDHVNAEGARRLSRLVQARLDAWEE